MAAVGPRPGADVDSGARRRFRAAGSDPIARFLRGAAIDEGKIPDIDANDAIRHAQPLCYLHPEHTAIHLLDKPICFDDTQEAIYRQPPPLMVVGTAGSGKTALTLKKPKHAEGEVLYVTQNPRAWHTTPAMVMLNTRLWTVPRPDNTG